jgi:hypothetical protein
LVAERGPDLGGFRFLNWVEIGVFAC